MTAGGENDDEAFIRAFDRREDERISSSLDMAFRRTGLAASPSEAERNRVEAIIARDRLDAARENARQLAQIEVREGVYVNIGDTVVEPTEEWLSKGDVRTFVPKQPAGTVRTIRTVRRVNTPIIIRMHTAGKITDDQVSACIWYRSRFELAGLEGRFKTSSMNPDATSGGGGGGMGQAPMAQHAIEVEARLEYRAARDSLPDSYLRFFEAIVLHDTPLRRATRFARCDNNRAFNHFRLLAQKLVEHCEAIGMKLGFDEDEGDA